MDRDKEDLEAFAELFTEDDSTPPELKDDGDKDAEDKDEKAKAAEDDGGSEPDDVDVSKDAEAEPEPEKPQHQVPLAQLLEERKTRQALEDANKELQAQLDSSASKSNSEVQALKSQIQNIQQALAEKTQQPAEKVDLFQDPDKFVSQLESKFSNQLTNTMLNVSEAYAVRQHGREAVDQAREAAIAAGVAKQFVSEPDPYGSLMDWHRNQQVLSATGGDLDAYKQKVVGELTEQVRKQILEELQEKGINTAGLASQGKPSPSLTDLGSSNGSSEPSLSDEEIFKQEFG